MEGVIYMIIEFENEESINGFDYIGLMMDLEDYLRRILHIQTLFC